MSDKTYFSKINDGSGDRYVKDTEIREIIENTEGFKTFEDNEFTYRNSGGNNDIETGLASIERIKGNTVAWNQLVKNGNFADTSVWATGNSTLSVSNNVGLLTLSSTPQYNYDAYISQLYPFITNHKYLFLFFIKCPHSGTVRIDSNGAFTNIDSSVESGVWTKIANIAVSSITSVRRGVSIYPLLLVDGYAAGNVIEYKNINIIDLTLIYGADNEPTTVEQFEADYERWFGKPLTYEEYDAGSLRPVLMQSVKTTGFNQWDEEWELGGYKYDDGTKYNISDRIRSKNFIKVFPNTSYFAKSAKGLSMFKYDKGYNYIGYSSVTGVFVTPDDCHYITFFSMGISYNNDICINISNPSKNGTYEPYEGHIASIPVTSAKGRLLDASGNPTGSTVTVFPDGLKKAGDVQDEIFVENGVVKAIKRVGSVDLGSLTWRHPHSASFDIDYFCTKIIDGKLVGSMNAAIPIKYILRDLNYWALNDLSCMYGAQFFGLGWNFYVRDDSYTDESTFKSAMNGVMLYYELATPETYILDNNLIDYPVNKYGTEEILSLPNGISPILDINYPVKSSNSLHTLVKDHISSKDMNTFLKEFENTTGIILNKVWNSNTNSYEFKYITSSEGDAFIKNKPIVAKDDAVQAAWGGAWRMPTTEEFQALGAATNTTWTQVNGVNGLLRTDKTDSSKTLFFPAAGYCGGGSVFSVGSYGLYWSSSLYGSNVSYARRLYFGSGFVYWDEYNYRSYGCAVRGVLDGSNVNANGHEYVEIGGLKWATMNVGANSITDYGLYFQWGDVQGYTASQVGSGSGQKYFGWADYKYGNGTSSPGATGITKYNATDGLTVLETSEPISCLHKVAVSGSYNDLNDKPSIPTVSDSVESTDSNTAASSKAVKTAYDLAASKVSNVSWDNGNGSLRQTIDGTTSSVISAATIVQQGGATTKVKLGDTDYSVSSNIISLPAYPTSLPASDVSSWAKAASKPTYTWDEIANKPIDKYLLNQFYLGYVAAHPENCYFTYINLGDAGYIGFVNSNYYYSKDLGKTWINVTQSSTTIGVSKGDIILFKGTITPQAYAGIGQFYSSVTYEIAGNIMSFIYGDDFREYTAFPSAMSDSAGFFEMFSGQTNLKDAKNLILPVKNVPYGAYGNMFYGCTTLVAGPIIDADTLGNFACNAMFSGCSKLSYINTRFKTIGSNALGSWTDSIASKGIFIKNVNATWTDTGTSGVPTGWTVYYDYQH